MFSFFQVTDKKKLAENARTSHPRAIGSSFFTTNTAFLLKKKNAIVVLKSLTSFCLDLVKGIMQLEITWALRMTRSLRV